MFENDWILSNLSNPDLDIDDLVSLGELNTTNTQFLSRDLYLKSNFIKNNAVFKNANGEFSKEKFDKYYDVQASRWKDFQNNEFPTGIELDAFDTASNRSNTKIKEDNFNLGILYNPDRVQIGIEGWRTKSERTKSEQELAQSQKIYNPDTRETENYTPNDYALFSSPIRWIENLFKEPLVLALYEENEVDEYGNTHKKGEYKLNQEGTYYYERLNGRSPIGKTILSAADILTKEDSVLNKIDFMDSDDLKKSTAGVIAKNIALIAPMFTPAAPYYYKAIIGKELVKTLPMLYNVATNLLGSGDNETPKWMNNLAAKGETLSTSNSVWSKEHTFSFENLANLISEIALQWGQQKQIAKAVTWFGDKTALKKAEDRAFELYKSKIGGNLKGLKASSDDLWKESTLGLLCLKKYYDPVLETMKRKQRFGADLSLAYMALISNTDVYADMIERGATKKEAAWVALGSTAAMFSVDRFAHLGEIFYDDLTSDTIKLGRKTIKQEFKKAYEQIYKTNLTSKQSPADWFKFGSNLGKKAAETFVENLKDHNLGGIGKAIGEGLEEVSEELTTDLTKSIYSLLGDLGMYDKSVMDTGAFDNMLERYSMSLIGGVLGGGLFYGIEKYQGFNKYRDKDLVDIINDGGALELRNLVKDYVLKGKAGNTKISGLKYTLDDSGNITWLSTNDSLESQNQLIGNKVLEKINALEAAIVGSGTKLSEDQLFDKMVLLEARYRTYKNASHVTGYYEEFAKLQSLYLDHKLAYDKAINTLEGTPDGAPLNDELKRNLSPEQLLKRLNNLLRLLEAIDNSLKRINDFLSGDSSLDYTRKLNFALDPILNAAFLGLDRTKWLLDKIDPNKESTLSDQMKLNKEWQDHVKDVMIHNLDSAFLAYKALENTIAPQMLKLQEYAGQYKNIFNSLKLLYDKKDLTLSEFLTKKPFYTIDSRLIDLNGIEETDEEYETRRNVNTPDEIAKFYKRQERVFDLNTYRLAEYIQQFDDILNSIHYSVDSSTNRTIILNIGFRLKDMIRREIEYPFIILGSVFDNSSYKSILEGLKDDLSNIDDIKTQLKLKRINALPGEITEFFNNLNANVVGVTSQYKSFNKPTIRKIIKNILNSNLENKEELINLVLEILLNINPESVAKLKEIVPKGFLEEYRTADVLFKKLLNVYSETRDTTTIQLLISDLLNPSSEAYIVATELGLNIEKTLGTLIESVLPFGKDSKIGLLDAQVDRIVYTGKSVESLIDTLNRYVDFLVRRILKNPVYSFYNKLKVNSHSPLESILNSVTKELSDDQNEVFNMNYILNLIYKDYISANSTTAFELNDTLAKLLNNALKVLDLLRAYIYSASTSPNGNHYFGLNKQINEFANTHKDQLVKEWQPLPEIDLEYALILLDEVNNLNREIELWKLISDNNTMNKTRRLVDTGNILDALHYKALKGVSFKFTVGDKQYDLSEGIDTAPIYDKTNGVQLLFNLEQTLYNNFNKILKETGWTAELFFKNTDFWKIHLGSYSDLLKLLVSKYSEKMTELTKYDEALYILSVMSDNPSNYWKSVQNFIKDNESIAPLPTLQSISKLSGAVHTKAYKAGFKALADLINPDMTVIPSAVHIDGSAGAGKTEVVLKSIRQRYYDLEALVVGPTSSQAIKLLNSLNEGISYTIEGDSNIFTKLFPEWDKINEQFLKAASAINKSNDNEDSKIDTEYFTIKKYKKSGFSGIKIELNFDKIKINPDVKIPLVFVDEAAHLNTFLIAMLGSYTDKVGGTLFLASGSNQSGYINGRIGNLENDNIFCTRTSKLLESLRSSNIQKQNNDNKVRAILDTFDDLYISGKGDEMDIFALSLPTLIGNMGLRVYKDKTDINGDLIDGNADEIIKLLSENHKDANIGFIGDENSPTYQKLKAAGFTKLSEPLTEKVVPGKKFMQGLEFDYVLIDPVDLTMDLKGSTSPSTLYATMNTLRRLYTLMSRGKIASIFLGLNLSELIGGNVQDSIKSKGYSILNLVLTFRDNYSNNINNLDLSQATQEEVPTELPQETIKKEGNKLVIAPEIEKTEDLNLKSEKSLEKELSKAKTELYNSLSEKEEDNTLDIDISNLAELLIEANTVVPITGLRETLTNPDGTSRRYPAWLPGEKTTVRRNINAIYDGSEIITKRVEKQRYQDIITSILSAILFDGKINNPELMSLGGFSESWKNRKIQFEIRKVTDYDNFGIGTDLKPTYIDINGTKYIISITCRLDGLSKSVNDEPYSAIFDICLLTDFNELRNPKKLLEIKNNINKRIKEGKILNIAKAENFRDNLNESIKLYELLVKSLVSTYPDEFSIELTPDIYTSLKTTRLKKRLTPRRLGGTLNIADVEGNITDEDGNYPEDHNNFIDTDKRKIVSPVYIVGNRSDILKGKISESVFGKACVFSSTNTNLDPEELVERWVELKNDPLNHHPEVRMIILNNHGLSFTELVTHRILKYLIGDLENAKKPWRMDTLGVRMFTAMWNFRAGLENFISLLNKWKSENGYSEEKVLDITKVESELFNSYGKEWRNKINLESTKIKNLLNSYKININDLDNLIKFNLEYCKNIPIFRLGIDLTRLQVGGYIRQFDVSTSTIYGKNLANMLAIEEEYANKYHVILSTILEQLTANEPPEIFKRTGLDFKPMATRLVKPDGTNYKSNEYIGKSEQQRNLSGLIHTNNKNIIIGETDNSGKIISKSIIPAESIFSFFPKAVTAIATKSRIYQTNNKASGLISISTIDTEDHTDKFDFDISELFKEGMLEKRGNDNTLFNMFNLIFHGSIENIEKPHAYTEDAPFKYGIFIDPDLEHSKNYKLINIRGKNGKDYAFLRCGTNPIYFDVDVDVIPGGMTINLSKLIELILNKKVKQVEKPKEEPKMVEEIQKYSSLILDNEERIKFLDYCLNEGKEDTEQTYIEYVSLLNNKKLINFFKKGGTLDNIVELINLKLEKPIIREVKYENGKVIYTDINKTSGELILDSEDLSITVIPSNTNSFEDLTKNSFNSMVIDYDGNNIMTHLEFKDKLSELFEEDETIQQLCNSTDIDSYLSTISDIDMQTYIIDKLELVEDSESIMNYLQNVNIDCY